LAAPDQFHQHEDHRHNLRIVLRQPGFRRLLTVRLLAQVADGLFQAGLAGSVLFNPQNATSPAAVAAGFAILLLPYSLIGPYLGVLLDRWSRRTVLVGANLARAGLVALAVALTWAGEQGILFGALVLIIIGLGRFSLAAMSAATPHVVDDDRLVTANAFASMLGSLAFSLGLAGVALLVRLGLPTNFHGYAAVAAAAPLGYLAAAGLARSAFPSSALGPDRTASRDTTWSTSFAEVGRGTLDGFRHLLDRRVAGSALAALGAHRVLYGVLSLAILLTYREGVVESQNLRAAMTGVGAVVLAGSLGTLLGSIITPAIARRIGGRRWLAILFWSSGATVAIFGMPVLADLLPVAIAWISLASQGAKIVVDTALQHECDDEFRGRVFSVNDTLFNVCFVAGTWLGSLVLPNDGRSLPVVLAVAAGYATLSVWYAVAGSRAERGPSAIVASAPEITARQCLQLAPSAGAPSRPPRVAAARAPAGGP
jgi:MFS family permease